MALLRDQLQGLNSFIFSMKLDFNAFQTRSSFQVSFPRAWLDKPTAAPLALKRLLSSVSHCVGLQCVRSCKCLFAFIAFVIPCLAVYNANVPLQRTFLKKSQITFWAFQRFLAWMSFQVHIQSVFVHAILSTLVALILTFTVVNKGVRSQRA